MPRDARDEEAADWLARARQDLRAVEVDLDADPPLSGDAAFHCQQAVEKALKAVLARHGHVFRRTHDIGELALAVLEHEPLLEPLLRESVLLTDYAWRFRYPGEVFEPARAKVDEALDIARRVVAAVAAAV
ncbi:MAG: HEPN domain-containing protein [Actinomycetota bacterium]|nr:HEPN domain-containing protein [Actinomycetota bacterium]